MKKDCCKKWENIQAVPYSSGLDNVNEYMEQMDNVVYCPVCGRFIDGPVNALQMLINAIQNADVIDRFEFKTLHERMDSSINFNFNTYPTGWINVNFNIRFLKR